MKHLFIVNPIAGKGRSMMYMEEIKPLLEGKVDYRIEITKGKGHATEIVKQYTSKDDYIVYAVGGDGTINEVVNGLVGTGSALAIVPAGSGNDLIRSVYPKCNHEELLYRLLRGTMEQLDLIKVNEGYFLNIASVGIDAEVAYNVSNFKKIKYIKGEMAYLLSIVKTLCIHKSKVLKIKVDGEEKCEHKVLLLAVANGRFYGGGIQIAPYAEMDDAKVDLYLVKDLKMYQIIPLLPKLFKGKHSEAKEVEVYHAGQVEIEGVEKFKLNIDGEIVETNKVKMEVLHKGIQVVIPAS